MEPTILANFLMEHVEEQDSAFKGALNDLNAVDWVSKALGNLRSKGAEEVADDDTVKDKRKELETEALDKVHFAYSEMFDTVTEDEAYKLTRILTFSHMSVVDAETAHHTLLTVTSMMKVADKRLVGWSCGYI